MRVIPLEGRGVAARGQPIPGKWHKSTQWNGPPPSFPERGRRSSPSVPRGLSMRHNSSVSTQRRGPGCIRCPSSPGSLEAAGTLSAAPRQAALSADTRRRGSPRAPAPHLPQSRRLWRGTRWAAASRDRALFLFSLLARPPLLRAARRATAPEPLRSCRAGRQERGAAAARRLRLGLLRLGLRLPRPAGWRCCRRGRERALGCRSPPRPPPLRPRRARR